METLVFIAFIVVGVLIVGLMPSKGKKPKSGGSGMFGVLEEIFTPNAYTVQQLQQQQEEAGAENPSPLEPIHTGMVVVINSDKETKVSE